MWLSLSCLPRPGQLNARKDMGLLVVCTRTHTIISRLKVRATPTRKRDHRLAPSPIVSNGAGRPGVLVVRRTAYTHCWVCVRASLKRSEGRCECVGKKGVARSRASNAHPSFPHSSPPPQMLNVKSGTRELACGGQAFIATSLFDPSKHIKRTQKAHKHYRVSAPHNLLHIACLHSRVNDVQNIKSTGSTPRTNQPGCCCASLLRDRRTEKVFV